MASVLPLSLSLSLFLRGKGRRVKGGKKPQKPLNQLFCCRRVPPLSSSSSSSCVDRQVTLKSSDDETFEVEQEVANMSETIKNLIEDAAADNDVIPLPNVSGKDLGKVIEYCKFKVSSKKKNSDGVLMSEDEVKNWETEFVKVDQGTLFQLILAANYLNIKDLLDLTCFTVASMIRGKSPEEIRKAFNIKNDFTPEEEEEVRREHQWAFD
mmetsp:Transcript_8375/g.15502  ORF Transcript_8375/g.15502 Transcript_8375/m.15502 type:complete len:210 (-) Transcript_8375:704-1333(-)